MNNTAKRIMAWLCAVCLVFALCACGGTKTEAGTETEAPAETEAGGGAEVETAYTPGTYTSTQTGMCGSFDVTVTFSENAIDAIDIGENNETLMVGGKAIEILPERILETQSLDVDAVTGATYTSYAVIYGVRNCVEQAGGNMENLLAAPAPVDTYDDLTHEADIIIVGGGLAGVSAAISAKENGADVILLEAKEYLGGNSTLSTGAFIFGGTTIQAALGIEDTADDFYEWALENSKFTKDPTQVAMVAYHGQELIDWYSTFGVNFNTEKISETDGSDIARGHAISPNMGTAVSTMESYMESLGVDIRYATKANGFLLDDSGEVVGVTATDYYGNPVEYSGNKIILASGGWGDNNDMIVKYWGKEYDGLVYGGSKGMDGAMLLAALELGADTVDMDNKHVDATLEVNKGVTITTYLLGGAGGILVRQSTGQRFVDEQDSHSEIAAAAMHELGDPYYYEIFDDSVFSYSEAVGAKSEAYVDMGLTTSYDTVEEMAEGMGVDADALTETIENYNAAVRGETADEYGRARFYDELTAPYYVMKVSNGVACTTGGLKVDENMQVINTAGNPIPNLYAIGEISGGFRINYVAGDSLSHSAISGMLIGKELAP